MVPRWQDDGLLLADRERASNSATPPTKVPMLGIALALVREVSRDVGVAERSRLGSEGDGVRVYDRAESCVRAGRIWLFASGDGAINLGSSLLRDRPSEGLLLRE